MVKTIRAMTVKKWLRYIIYVRSPGSAKAQRELRNHLWMLPLRKLGEDDGLSGWTGRRNWDLSLRDGSKLKRRGRTRTEVSRTSPRALRDTHHRCRPAWWNRTWVAGRMRTGPEGCKGANQQNGCDADETALSLLLKTLSLDQCLVPYLLWVLILSVIFDPFVVLFCFVF